MNLELLFVGDAAHPEMAAVAVLRKAAAVWCERSTSGEAASLLSRGFQPHVIVVAQRWPGEVATNVTLSLLRKSPLSRVVWLLGSWSSGAAGTPSRQGPHAYAWNEVDSRLLPDLCAFADGRRSALGLPDTAGPEESLGLSLARPANGVRPSSAPCRATVWSADPEFRSVLVDTLKLLVPNVAALAVEDPCSLESDVHVWDLTPWSPPLRERLAAFHAHRPDVPVMAIAEFPRKETLDALLRDGASTVLVKPVRVVELAQQFRELLANP